MTFLHRAQLLLLFLLFFTQSSFAQRVPVLNQIDLPHNYYFRELYLPQLTTGPSSVAWMPDGKSVIYSMEGSLWRQVPGEPGAVQLTDDNGYDYQPDVSPDGSQVVFVRYDGASTELMLYQFSNRTTQRLTFNNAVNLEPRWSPNGKHLSYVSTEGSGHFLLYVMDVENGQFSHPRCLTPDHRSEVKRYYYSPWDHTINASWSPDSQYLYAVSNREIPHGTGDIVKLEQSTGKAVTIHHEETSWQTKPEVSPDGTRLLYASYVGSNWHQLWLIPAQGGSPMQLTYGDYDNRMARWSPDGKTIAFISNRTGNTSLWTLSVFTGKQQPIVASERRYLQPRVPLDLIITDAEGREVPARISVTDNRGKSFAPVDAWMQADDSRYPATNRYEAHYFHSPGRSALMVPRARLTLRIAHGWSHESITIPLEASAPFSNPVRTTLKKITFPGTWWSGDVHLHMNYGGHYRNEPKQLLLQARAEDLQILYNLVVNKEQRMPDINEFRPGPDPLSTAETTLMHSQEFHTSFWGHMGLLGLQEHVILPGYTGYPETGVESLFPHNGFIADEAHRQKGLVGYVHPFESADVYPEASPQLFHELPVDAALKKIDYYEVIGFADHKGSAFVWYQLMNAGIRIAAAAGTDAMANYASLRGPVGLNRVYVKGNGTFSREKWEEGLKAGHSFVTNGPLIDFTLSNVQPGDSLKMTRSGSMPYRITYRSDVPADALEIVYNGRVIVTHPLRGGKSADLTGNLKISESGWVIVRAVAERSDPDHYDLYPYATTNPVYLKTPVANSQTGKSAAYLLKWVDHIDQQLATLPFRTEAERTAVRQDVAAARAYYQRLIR